MTAKHELSNRELDRNLEVEKQVKGLDVGMKAI